MNAGEYGESFLLAQFREFYGEVIRLKRAVESGGWVMAADRGPGEAPDYTRAASAIWQRLQHLLEQQDIAAVRRGGAYWSAMYQEAQFVMAALADEIFLHLSWEGKEVWNANLLESQFFNSHSAGEIFFEKLERLLENSGPDQTELAKVYLMALALGFQGKYRGTGNERELHHFRQKLFSFIARRDPDILKASKSLFPDAYAHTLDAGSGKRLPDVRQWIVAVALALLVWVIVGHGLWIYLTADLDRAIQQILASR